MAERKAQNKYYPPDWDPSKGSLNQFQRRSKSTNPDRKYSSTSSKVGRTIRFEMPYNIWCTSCEHSIGRGVRFNAQKTKNGQYYSTILWRFTMKCPSCSGKIVIDTDPKNSEYLIGEGGRRKVEDANAQQMGIHGHNLDPEAKKSLDSNPFFKLEHQLEDKSRSRKIIPTLKKIQSDTEIMNDDWQASRKIRDKLRLERQVANSERLKTEKIKSRLGERLDLVDEREEDIIFAKNSTADKRSSKKQKSSSSILARYDFMK